jgi:hypothetical protein
MGSKNKGGREVRKPKADKKPKPAATSIVPATQRSAANQSQAPK